MEKNEVVTISKVSSIDRNAADILEVNDFVDLTRDHQCFVCDKMTSHLFYSLIKTVTNTSKTEIAQKLGELVGKSYIIVVSEDDYICQNCVNLFNQLDSLECQLKDVKTSIIKHLECTYLNKNIEAFKLPNHIYKALQIMVNNEQDDSTQSTKKRKLSEKILRNVQLPNYTIEQTKTTKTEICTKKYTRKVDKENFPSHQKTITKNVCPSKLNNNINISGYSLKQNNVHSIDSIKMDNQNCIIIGDIDVTSTPNGNQNN